MSESPPIGPYQLRAFSSNTSSGSTNGSSGFISSLEQHQERLNSLLDDAPIENKPVYSSLSSDLVNETLNYFVNCRQRLNQMTKTYDDTDAYIFLLQEKEVDLELAARIGQDLLRQNKQLRESLQNLEKQLTQRQDDIQQLKYDLASKSTLLETFIEEEQYQQQQRQDDDEHSQNNNNNRSLTSDSYDDLRSSSQITNIISNNKLYYSSHSSSSSNNNNINNNNSNNASSNHNNHGHPRPGSNSSSIIQSSSSNHDFMTANNSVIQESDENDFHNGNYNEEDELHNRPFYSLTPRLNNPPSQASTAEPFSSLPYNLTPGINSRFCSRSESTQPLSRDDSSSCIFETNDVQPTHANHNQLQQPNQNVIHQNQQQQQQQQQQRVKEQQKLVDSVTFRLVESNKRLCELQDELLYKCEQNLMQQEKIFQLQEQLNDTDKRLCDMTAQNETLQKSIVICENSKRELSDELRVCKINFNELLNVFLEMQRETRDLYLQSQFHQAHHHPNNNYNYSPRYLNSNINHAPSVLSMQNADNFRTHQSNNLRRSSASTTASERSDANNYVDISNLTIMDRQPDDLLGPKRNNNSNNFIQANHDNQERNLNEVHVPIYEKLSVYDDNFVTSSSPSKPPRYQQHQQQNKNCSTSLLDELQESMQINGEFNKRFSSQDNLLYNHNILDKDTHLDDSTFSVIFVGPQQQQLGEMHQSMQRRSIDERFLQSSPKQANSPSCQEFSSSKSQSTIIINTNKKTTMSIAEDEIGGKKGLVKEEEFEGYFQISASASSTTATVYVVSSILLILLAKKSYCQLTYR